MKKLFVVLFCLLSLMSWSQRLNDYKYVVVPLKFDFMKIENEYRLSTQLKSNLEKMGFKAYYNTVDIPREIIADACNLLQVSIERSSGLVWTKFRVVFRDCQNRVVHTSDEGRSKAKVYQVAYQEALENAFVSLYDLKYSYSGKSNLKKADEVVVATPKVSTSMVSDSASPKSENTLYAQPLPNGYQLVDQSPKVVFLLYKTSNETVFIAQKGNQNGVVFLRDQHWFFEYLANEKVVSEPVIIKF